MQQFRSKRILITGGSAGIGLGLALGLAKRGATLALIARGKEGLERAAAQIRELDAEAYIHPCDVTDPEALGEAIQSLTDAMGGLDGVIANSGFCQPGRFHEISKDDMARQIDTNITGVLYTLHECIPFLLESPAPFIAVTSSPAGSAGIFGYSIYGATKAALNNLLNALRFEYEPCGIAVYTLLPPDTDTPGYAEEIKHYPPETRAILEGGRLHPTETVVEALIRGMERGKRHITIGMVSHLLFFLVRHCPKVWEWYSKRSIKKTQKTSAQKII